MLRGVLTVAGLIAAYAFLIEPRRLVVRRHDVALDAWPERLDGMVVACVSDLHTGAPHVKRSRVRRVVERTNRLRPDLVALLGDFVDRDVRGSRREPPEAVAEELARLAAPAVAVLGNHDWSSEGSRMAEALHGAGITVLEDAATRVDGVHVAGVGDLRERGADIAAALETVPAGEPVLLLSHDPDVFPGVPDRVALTLSGHTHGGQVDIPRLRARFIPSRFGDRYARGVIRERGRTLFVTSGIGTSGWPVRLLRPPEIALLTLRAAGGPGAAPSG